MNKIYSAIARITFWDSIEEKESKENIVITEVDSFTDALHRIEDYYGIDLLGVSLQLLDNKFITIPDTLFEELAEND